MRFDTIRLGKEEKKPSFFFEILSYGAKSVIWRCSKLAIGDCFTFNTRVIIFPEEFSSLSPEFKNCLCFFSSAEARNGWLGN